MLAWSFILKAQSVGTNLSYYPELMKYGCETAELNDQDMTCILGRFKYYRPDADSVLVVPEQIVLNEATYTVVGLADYAFSFEFLNNVSEQCNAKKIIIPNTVARMGYNLFSSNKTIEEVILPDGLKVLPYKCFNWCQKLQKVYLPESLEKLEGQVFYGCTSLKSIDLPDNIREIGYIAFCYCENLSEVHLPKLLESFEKRPIAGEFVDATPFAVCPQLSTLTISEDNQNFCIKDNVLYNKDQTEIIYYAAQKPEKRFIMPTNVRKIDMNCFNYCYNLEEVILPEELDTIAPDAFSYNVIKRINIPAHVKLPDRYSLYDYTFISAINSNGDLQDVVVEEGRKELTLFLECGRSFGNEIHISLPEGLERIPFLYSYAKELVIPESVHEMQMHIGYYKDTINLITMQSPIPPSNAKTKDRKIIASNSKRVIVRVPDGCKETYLAHPDWQDDTLIIVDETEWQNEWQEYWTASVRGIRSQGKDSKLYDLQGRKLNSEPEKGIYIKNGRKVAK